MGGKGLVVLHSDEVIVEFVQVCLLGDESCGCRLGLWVKCPAILCVNIICNHEGLRNSRKVVGFPIQLVLIVLNVRRICIQKLL